MPSSNAIRQQLLADFGECVCSPDMCFDDPNGDGYCRPCARLDPYWECFAAEEDGMSEEDRREIDVDSRFVDTEDARDWYREDTP